MGGARLRARPRHGSGRFECMPQGRTTSVGWGRAASPMGTRQTRPGISKAGRTFRSPRPRRVTLAGEAPARETPMLWWRYPFPALMAGRSRVMVQAPSRSAGFTIRPPLYGCHHVPGRIGPADAPVSAGLPPGKSTCPAGEARCCAGSSRPCSPGRWRRRGRPARSRRTRSPCRRSRRPHSSGLPRR